MCLVCGAISGNLEMIDFDNWDYGGSDAYKAWQGAVEEALPGLLERLVIETTPSGGRHVVYRCEAPVSGSTKLVQREIIVGSDQPVYLGSKECVPRLNSSGEWIITPTIIETRGERSLFLCDPSPGYEVIQGELCVPPVVTSDERNVMLECARAMDETAPPKSDSTPLSPRVSGSLNGSSSRPGDDFNGRGDPREILLRHGWALEKAGKNEHWRRPGKTEGTSATLKDRIFYVFSSNAAPFEPNKGYLPFSVYALLEHHGDFSAAASALAAEGYGSREPTAVVARTEDSAADPPVSTMLTDVGNAGRLVDQYRDRIRYCYGPSQWMIWDGKRWRPDERGRIVKLCKKTALDILDEAKLALGKRQQELVKWAMASQRRERLTAMAVLAQPEVAVGPDELDTDPWAFNVLNGTIDLQSGDLRPHRREDLITKIAPVEYDAAATAPRFDRFLNEIFGGDLDLIRFVQRWHGHCLSADVREQYLLIYHGEGNNGKSVLLDTICAVMGDYAGEAPPDLVTVRKHAEHPTEIADLLGKRLVVASETEHEAELRLQLVKRLTGNARLKARLMRQDFFEFARTHKMILVTNNRPSIREDTEAVWRRLRLVPFEVVIPMADRDPNLMRALWDERAGILAWLVRGCVEWLREGLTEPDAVIHATEEYRGRANSIDAFLLDRCVLGDGLACATSDLKASYGDWCAQNQRMPIQGKAFAAALKERSCAPTKRGGNRHWVGLALDDQPSGQNGQIGHELSIEQPNTPHDGVNGNLPSNAPNASTDGSAKHSEHERTGGVADG